MLHHPRQFGGALFLVLVPRGVAKGEAAKGRWVDEEMNMLFDEGRTPVPLRNLYGSTELTSAIHYLGDEATTQAALDKQGYYKSGDFGHLVGDQYVIDGRSSTDYSLALSIISFPYNNINFRQSSDIAAFGCPSMKLKPVLSNFHTFRKPTSFQQPSNTYARLRL
ncbi:hypothetical protein BJX76DRAFT_358618 [Aspergillus varians]